MYRSYSYTNFNGVKTAANIVRILHRPMLSDVNNPKTIILRSHGDFMHLGMGARFHGNFQPRYLSP